MEDFRTKIAKLLAEAEDCELIAKLSPDPEKRATFVKLALHLKALARDAQAVLDLRANNDAA